MMEIRDGFLFGKDFVQGRLDFCEVLSMFFQLECCVFLFVMFLDDDMKFFLLSVILLYNGMFME